MNVGFSNLDTLKKHLLPGSLGAEVKFDLVITAIGLGMAGAIEQMCNRKFARAVGEQEIFPADRITFPLSRFPLESVASAELKLNEADGWTVQAGDFINTIDLAEGIITLPHGSDPGPDTARVRFTFTGGYWWEQLEPKGAGYPSAMPDGANLLPDELRLAWLLQCQHIWASRDKLGTGLVDKPEEQSSLGTAALIPLVKQMLQPFIRYQLT